MIKGQKFSLDMLLAPYGFTGEDFYVFIAALGAFLTVMMVGRVFIVRNTFASRVKLLQERRQSLKEEITAPKRRRKNQEEAVNIIRKIVTRLQLLQKSQIIELTEYLISSGIRNKDMVFIFAFFKLVTPIAFFGIALLLFPIDFSGEGPKWKMFMPIAAAYFGLKLPSLLVANKRTKRYVAIQRSLADTLDLLMICAEAGLSLAQSLERVSGELQHAYPEMADELSLTSIELNFQPDRQKTLRNLAKRVQLPEIRGIVNVLIQTEKYGTPIAQALRTLGTEFRTQRMLRAEQKAARLPALMTIPMIIFILPTMFIIVIAPAVINLLDT